MLPFFRLWLAGGPSSWDMLQDIQAVAGAFFNGGLGSHNFLLQCYTIHVNSGFGNCIVKT